MSAVSDPKDKTEFLKVVVRCHAISNREIDTGYESVVEVDTKTGSVAMKNPDSDKAEPKKVFNFETVYDLNSKQQDVYERSFRDVVDSVLQGYNGTIFAYGQTGAGKTHTIHGVNGDPDQRGLIPRSAEHIFHYISQSENQQYLIHVTYIQIYQETIHDLLVKDTSKRLDLKEKPDTGVYVKDVTSVVIKNEAELEQMRNIGNLNKDRWITFMSPLSSKITTVFTITVECCELGENGDKHIRVGRLNLVEMAGSETTTKTGTTGCRLKEATRISMSLSSFGLVISALVDDKSKHIPYRDSKVTRLLQDSLGGTARTIMVACIGPASANYNETMRTLRYANRARYVKNKPKINIDPNYSLLLEYQREIERLKARLIDDRNILEDRCMINNEGESVSHSYNTDGARNVVERSSQEQETKQDDEKYERKQNFPAKTGELHDEASFKEEKDMNAIVSKIKALENKLIKCSLTTKMKEDFPPSAGHWN